jgi:2,3-diketo-5-methylthiopentyl-1-phosphate enolase
MTAWLKERPDMIQVTYRVLSDKLIDPEKKARAIALGQTTDSWTPNERSGLKKLEIYRGEVLGVDERTHVEGKPYEYYMTVGYPTANTEGDLASVLTMIFGKISMDGKIRLTNLQFPDKFLKHKGPRFGIEGIRQRVDEPKKPLQMAIFKPCVGLTPSELGEMFYQLALAGMHLVKDDEILPDIPSCPTEKRLEACLKAAEKAVKTTGKKTLYAVNLTGKPSEIIGKAQRLAKQGAHCFLFNVLSYGYGLLEELREVGVPIMAHPALAGAWSGATDTGMAYGVVLGTLMRAGGADIVLFPSSYGTVALPKVDTEAIKEALTQPMSGLKKSFSAPSAGIHPGLVPRIVTDFGRDVIINAGGGVHGHPQGVRAGVRAFRQAIRWSETHKDFTGLSANLFPELTAALKLWGRG